MLESSAFFNNLETELKSNISGHDSIINSILNSFNDEKFKIIGSNNAELNIHIDNTSNDENINNAMDMETFLTKTNMLINLEDELRKRVIGQDHVLNDIVEIVSRGEMDMTRENATRGNFLFCGPTGVGKTEVSLALANAIYGDESKIARFDMSEFMLKESVATLNGDEANNDPGRLGKAIKRLGHSGGILLIDEMEKAHQDIMLLFLGALDAARLTCGDGVTYDLQNFYFIFTSNIGAMKIALGRFKSNAAMKRAVISEMFELDYKPEFIGRFHKMLCFNKLDFEAQELLAKLKINQEVKRLNDKGHDIKFKEDFILYAIEFGADPTLGARPMRNFIESNLQNALVDKQKESVMKGKPKLFIKGSVKVDPVLMKCWIEEEELVEV